MYPSLQVKLGYTGQSDYRERAKLYWTLQETKTDNPKQ